MDIKILETYIESKLENWHSNFSFPLKAEMLEETLVRIFYENMGLEVEWETGSHSPGMDIQIMGEESFSVKSGKETENDIKISSSRTTSYKTIEEKIDFYKRVEDTFTHYFLLSKYEKSNSIRYTPYIIPKDIIQIEDVLFEEVNSGWSGKSSNYSFDIKRSMSDQIWITISKEYVKDYALKSISFDIERKDNGLSVFTKK